MAGNLHIMARFDTDLNILVRQDRARQEKFSANSPPDSPRLLGVTYLFTNNFWMPSREASLASDHHKYVPITRNAF